MNAKRDIQPPTGPVTELVRLLRADRRWARHFEAWHELPGQPARFAEWPATLGPEVCRAAHELGFERPFTHQAEAFEAVVSGAHVAVATGTASGKSLCYLLPILDQAVRSPRARALLVFPTKALAHDQLNALRRWDRALTEIDLRPAAYDGDTPTGDRRAIRRTARAVLTNPDMLHTGILPHHTRWATMFEGLTHVVLDEMHVYRGVFGSHVANVLRRLRRVARFYGSEPQFVMTSATIANPGELGGHLAGAPVRVIAGDGSPRGPRIFAFYNPPVVDERLNLRRSPVLEAEALAGHFLAGGVQTIIFARTRQTAELIVRYITEGRRAAAGAESSPLVRGYRGGYMAGERRAIEAALRDGRLRGVVATNALELGVDIGALDACIMTGYPGTIASTWQQAGRAGRRLDAAFAVLVAGSTPLDQFIVRHPDYFFGRSPEHARLDPDNLLILLDHVRCAAFELPFGPEEAALPFGGPAPGPGSTAPLEAGAAGDSAQQEGPQPVGYLLAVLAGQGVIREAADTWYWMADAYPASEVGLRSAGPDAVTIVRRQAGARSSEPGVIPGRGEQGSSGTPGGMQAGPPLGEAPDSYDVLGTVEREVAALMVHPRAVYLHDGAAYEVEALDWERGRAVVVPSDGALYTRASSSVEVRPTRVSATRAAPGVEVHHGELEVRSCATGFRKIRFRTHETVGWEEIDLPEHRHVAGSYWFTLDDDTVAHLRTIGRWQHDPSGRRGASWREQRERARARDGYRCRLCGSPERPGQTHDVHHIRPFREFSSVEGEPEAHREANALDNLITLCRSCHRVAERALGLHGGLSGVGYALSHIAPLYLMCDARDLGVATESHAPWTGRPTVAVYERAAAGVGFGEALFDLHEAVVRACGELIADCPCTSGCPSCVGPSGEHGPNAKAHALAVLGALGARAVTFKHP